MTEQQALSAGFNESQSELIDVISGLSEQQASEVWYGTWGVKEIVAHISGWENALATALEQIARGERPSVPGIDLNDTDGTNATFAAGAKNATFAATVDGLQGAGDRVIMAINALPDDRIEEGRTARRIIDTLTHHPDEHMGEIRAWRSSGS